jgi:hypothetical protein
MLLKALVKVPVEPLFSAAERLPSALAAPEFLLALLSLLSVIVVVVAVDVVVVVVVVSAFAEAVLALLSVLVLVLTLLLLLSVSVVAMLLVLPPSVVCELSTCADAAVLKPKAKAMADAMSVNFMKYSPDVG